MRVWIFSLGQRVERVPEDQVYAELLARAELAEELGFHGMFVAEHHFSNYSAIPYPLMLLAAMSQRTERLRLGPAVVLLPLYNPVRLAEDIAMLDNLSGGRAEIVVGRGYAAYEFRGLGVDKSQSSTLMEEGLDILTTFWRNEVAEYQGTHWQIPEVTLIPRPFQQPQPPLWWAVGSRESLASALDRGLDVICASSPVTGPDALRSEPNVDLTYGLFREECDARGIDPSSVRFGAQFATHVTSDPEEIDRALNAARWNHKLATRLITDRQIADRGFVDMSGHEPIDDLTADQLSRYWMICDPEAFEQKVAHYQSLGVTDLSLNVGFGGLDDVSVRRSMETIAEVLQLRSLA